MSNKQDANHGDDSPAQSTPSGKRRRGSGPRLNDLQRLEIIRKRRQTTPPVSLRQLAREYHVDEKTIRRVVSSADEIEARAASSSLAQRQHAFRRPTPKFPELERRLTQWIDAKQRAKGCVTPSIVIEEARRLAQAMEIDAGQFKASWGWYEKFSKRHGLWTAALRYRGSGGNDEDPLCGAEGETGTVDCGKKVDVERSIGSGVTLAGLHALMEQYDPNWVFTMDEVALFYDNLPPMARAANDEADSEDGRVSVVGDRTQAGGGDDVLNGDESDRGCHRNRVTLVVCCNSTGMMSVPVGMVGKAQWPLQRRGGFPVPYFHQRNAWVDRTTFGKWFDEVFCKFVQARPSGKKVLLIVDGSKPGNQANFEHGGIRVVKFPSTGGDQSSGSQRAQSWRYPLQMGVVSAFKLRIKHLLLKDVVGNRDSSSEIKQVLAKGRGLIPAEEIGVVFGQSASLLDTARYISRAWNEMPAEVLRTCFQRANMVPSSAQLHCRDGDDSTRRPLSEGDEGFARQEDSVVSEMKKLLALSSLVPGSRSSSSDVGEIARQINVFIHIDDCGSASLQYELACEINNELVHSQVEATTDEIGEAEPLQLQSQADLCGLLTKAIELEVGLRRMYNNLTASRTAEDLDRCIDAAGLIRRFMQYQQCKNKRL